MPRELTGDEKILELARQLRVAEMGISRIITCPYCHVATDFSPTPERDADGGVGLVLCCEKFGLAMAAIVGREETNELVDLAHRLEDRAAGQAQFN